MSTFDRAAYMKEKYKQYLLRLDVDQHPEMIKHLDSLGHGEVNRYLRSLIKEDMDRIKHENSVRPQSR